MRERAGTSAVTQVAEEPVAWSLPTRIAFRFCFIYLLLYLLPRPFWGMVPPIPVLNRALYEAWKALLAFVTGRILSWSPPEGGFNFGGGDAPTDYVRLLCCAVFALAGTAVWSAMQRSSAGHPRLHDAFRIYLRYVLGLSIIGYGLAKFFGQFSQGPLLMIRPVGQLEPMQMLWAFMSASTAYTYATGVVEIAGGFLLFFRRTTLLGAVLVVAAMANVVALNLAYDVQVKIQSIHFVLVALFLIAPDARRVAHALLRREDASPWTARTRRVLLVSEALLTAVVVVFLVLFIAERSQQETLRLSLHGLHDVVTFTQDSVPLPPLTTDKVRWRRVGVDQRFGDFGVQMMDDTVRRFLGQVDASKQVIVLKAAGGTSSGELRYTEPESGRVVLEGHVDGRQLTVELRRIPEESWPLIARKFRWTRR